MKGVEPTGGKDATTPATNDAWKESRIREREK